MELALENRTIPCPVHQKTAAEMQRHCDVDADFIYLHKTGVTYLDVETSLPIDLPDILNLTRS